MTALVITDNLVVFKGLTDKRYKWRVEIRRMPNASFRHKYLANVHIGYAECLDRIIYGAKITAPAARPDHRTTVPDPPDEANPVEAVISTVGK
jgi:hypothetical protein